MIILYHHYVPDTSQIKNYPQIYILVGDGYHSYETIALIDMSGMFYDDVYFAVEHICVGSSSLITSLENTHTCPHLYPMDTQSIYQKSRWI